MVNGNLVEGMTNSSEQVVVAIIKTITGDVHVVAKRGTVAPSAPVAVTANESN